MSLYLCIECEHPVTQRQQALQCDSCDNWQHRICNTGVSQQQYRAAVRNEVDLDWRCKHCCISIQAVPIAESTRLSEAASVAEAASVPETAPGPEAAPGSSIADAASIPEAASSLEVASGPEFGSFEIPVSMDEESMEDAIPGNVVTDEQQQPVRFEIIESASQRGKRKLVESSGYTYTVKRRYDEENAVWRCSCRNKTTSCSATIRQRGAVYTPGPHVHCHQPLVGAGIAAKVVKDVKDKAMQNYFQPAGAIVDQVTFTVVS